MNVGESFVMSRKANPSAIGAFVLLGSLLAVITVIYIGSVRLFSQEVRFLLYFKESVNGLSVGSPVKFKGVTIGRVSDIKINYNQSSSVSGAYIPVFVDIDFSKVADDRSSTQLSDWEFFSREIRKGLRGRLQLESFITGQLFVELDYFAKQGEDFKRIQAEVIEREIPTVPSIMAELGASTADVVAKITAIDFQGISSELRDALRALNTTVSAIDSEKWNRAVLDAAEQVRVSLEGVRLKETTDRLNQLLEDFSGLAIELERGAGPLFEDLGLVSDQLVESLAQADKTMEHIRSIAAEDAGLQRKLIETLNELKSASRAARELMEFLERNPQSLLTGRKSP